MALPPPSPVACPSVGSLARVPRGGQVKGGNRAPFGREGILELIELGLFARRRILGAQARHGLLEQGHGPLAFIDAVRRERLRAFLLVALFGEGGVEGVLMGYSANRNENRRYAASFVDRILKGANPGDLPFEQATHMELVVNTKAAKALGITFPQTVLFRADQVVE